MSVRGKGAILNPERAYVRIELEMTLGEWEGLTEQIRGETRWTDQGDALAAVVRRIAQKLRVEVDDAEEVPFT